MDFAFSFNWIFIVLTLACLVFLFQILFDYNRQASVLRPQIQHIAEIRARHAEEIEKVEALARESEAEAAQVEQQIAELEKRYEELEATLKSLEENEAS